MTMGSAGNLIFDCLEVGPLAVNCYLLGRNGEGVIIDPGDEAERILAAVAGYGLEIKAIVLTHGHSDHIGAVADIKDKLKAPVCIHREDARMLIDPMANLSAVFGEPIVAREADRLLNDGESISAGGLTLEIIHTPGHTRGGISLWENNLKIVFTGDALFADSIGRTDFPHSNHQQLINGIKKNLLTLPRETIVYPGHGPSTTIGQEKDNNPWLN